MDQGSWSDQCCIFLCHPFTCICWYGSLDNDEQSAESTYLPIIGSGPATDGGMTSPLERTRWVCVLFCIWIQMSYFYCLDLHMQLDM